MHDRLAKSKVRNKEVSISGVVVRHCPFDFLAKSSSPFRRRRLLTIRASLQVQYGRSGLGGSTAALTKLIGSRRCYLHCCSHHVLPKLYLSLSLPLDLASSIRDGKLIHRTHTSNNCMCTPNCGPAGDALQ